MTSAANSPLYAFQIGRQLGAYNANTGKWDVINLKEDARSSMLASGHTITVTSNKGLYVLDAANGTWQITEFDDDKLEK